MQGGRPNFELLEMRIVFCVLTNDIVLLLVFFLLIFLTNVIDALGCL